MTATDNYTNASLGLVQEGVVAGLFTSDGTAITAGAAVVMEAATDLMVQIADAAAAQNCIGVANAAVAATVGDPVSVVCRGPVVKVLYDGTTDIAAGNLLQLDDDGSFITATAVDVTTTHVRATINAAINMSRAVVGIALQAGTEDGDSGLIMLL